MQVAWDPLAIAGLASLALGWTVALVVLFTRPDRAQNRWLAASLLVMSTSVFFGTAARVLLEDPRDVLAAARTWLVLSIVATALYVRFLATIPVPLTRMLRERALWRRAATGGLLALALLLTVRPELAAAHLVRSEVAGVHSFARGPLFMVAMATVFVVLSFALVVSIAARRHATTELGRRQANAYAAAFLFRDALSLSVVATAFFFPAGAAATVLPALLVLPLADAGFSLLIAYGVLRAQLFDIDLRLKRTIRQSTIAGVLVGAFFIVSEATQQIAAERMGPMLGIVAAGALVFAMSPLQRLADRLSDAAMPSVRDTAEYRTVRKREVYRAALESVMTDGKVTPAERAVLATLADELGLGAREVLDIETEAGALRAA
ncbi:MAG TPA: hypothetical protein VFH78_10045 [Candidatus Thermoplasmatota archaeon]|nr:hypothetical protein [Candidatus Thermoplasmatota archaeon]